MDLIVVGFEETEDPENPLCLVQPTAGSGPIKLEDLLNKEVVFEDFKAKLWQGRVIEVREDMVVVKFPRFPDGLGHGSLVRISIPGEEE